MPLPPWHGWGGEGASYARQLESKLTRALSEKGKASVRGTETESMTPQGGPVLNADSHAPTPQARPLTG